MPQDLSNVSIGLGYGLMPSGGKPSPEPMLTKVHDVIWGHQGPMNFKLDHQNLISMG